MVVIHSWAKLAKKPIPVQAALSVEALGEYVGRLDDLIDQLRAPALSNKLHYRSNRIVRKHISDFVHGIKTDSRLSTAQRREIFTLAGNFRRNSWKTLERYENKALNLTEMLKMKEATSGEYGKLFSAILNVSARVPESQRAKIEEAFANMAMAVQVYDDLTDFHIDRRQGVPNILMGALQENPRELLLALSRQTLRPLWLRKNCPNTYRRIQEILGQYISRLPAETLPEQAFRAFPRVLWYLAQMRRGTKPEA